MSARVAPAVAHAEIATRIVNPANVYPPSALQLVVLFAALGAVTFAPHVLTSLCALEVSDPDKGSTAMGVVKALGQVGGALAGSPVAAVVMLGGWYTLGLVLAVCSAVSAAAYSRLWSVSRRSSGAPSRP